MAVQYIELISLFLMMNTDGNVYVHVKNNFLSWSAERTELIKPQIT